MKTIFQTLGLTAISVVFLAANPAHCQKENEKNLTPCQKCAVKLAKANEGCIGESSDPETFAHCISKAVKDYEKCATKNKCIIALEN